MGHIVPADLGPCSECGQMRPIRNRRHTLVRGRTHKRRKKGSAAVKVAGLAMAVLGKKGVSDGKVDWSSRGAACVFADFHFRERLRERLGFGADGKHCVRPRCSNTRGRRTE
jgi:hypothetical protein